MKIEITNESINQLIEQKCRDMKKIHTEKELEGLKIVMDGWISENPNASIKEINDELILLSDVISLFFH